MTINVDLDPLRKFLRDADSSIDISMLVLSEQSYWLGLTKNGYYEHAFWRGVNYYFYRWLNETKGSDEARTIINYPGIGTVIREFVDRMVDQ